MGDGAFTFNRKGDKIKIIGKVPFSKKNRAHSLSTEERNYNTRLSKMRVEIEHFFAKLKCFSVCDLKFRHFTSVDHVSLDFELIVHVVTKIISWKKQSFPSNSFSL